MERKVTHASPPPGLLSRPARTVLRIPMLPRTMVGCSSKSYFTVEQARAWGPQVVAGVSGGADGTEGLFVCPSFPLVPALLETFGAAGGLVGAQDVSPYPSGAYTGEVSAEVLAQLGVRLVMAGHPERRRLFGETDDVIRAKVAAIAAAGMAPILVVAYEPAWAIGRPQPAPPEHVAASTLAVRKLVEGRAADPRVIYGGSAQPGTFRAIRAAASTDAAVPDGVFMARFGIDPQDFLTVVAEVRGAG